MHQLVQAFTQTLIENFDWHTLNAAARFMGECGFTGMRGVFLQNVFSRRLGIALSKIFKKFTKSNL